jgi:hypothetical protein
MSLLIGLPESSGGRVRSYPGRRHHHHHGSPCSHITRGDNILVDDRSSEIVSPHRSQPINQSILEQSPFWEPDGEYGSQVISCLLEKWNVIASFTRPSYRDLTKARLIHFTSSQSIFVGSTAILFLHLCLRLSSHLFLSSFRLTKFNVLSNSCLLNHRKNIRLRMYIKSLTLKHSGWVIYVSSRHTTLMQCTVVIKKLHFT